MTENKTAPLSDAMFEGETGAKLGKLSVLLGELGRVAICLSGGTDSAMLLAFSVRVLGRENVMAITAETDFFTGGELSVCKQLTAQLGLRLHALRVPLLEENDVLQNSRDRCYFCKRRMLRDIKALAEKYGYASLLDGSNADDEHDYRPGARACSEVGVISPLVLAKLNKSDIKEALRRMGLADYIQPVNACLATRIATGERITMKRLRDVCAMENCLHAAGFDLVRVRVSGTSAVIEVERDRLPDLYSIENWIIDELKQFGFDEVTISPEGYRPSGSLFLRGKK